MCQLLKRLKKDRIQSKMDLNIPPIPDRTLTMPSRTELPVEEPPGSGVESGVGVGVGVGVGSGPVSVVYRVRIRSRCSGGTGSMSVHASSVPSAARYPGADALTR